jgi:hypothetical protein
VDRREFLAKAGAITIVTASGAGAVAIGAPSAEAGTGAYPRRPLVDWELVGGFLAPGFAALRPARLVAYPGGLAIADAERHLQLRQWELDSLRRHAVAVLRNPANGRRRPGAPIIADAPATLFRARGAADKRYAIQAEALEESRRDHAYPRPLYALADHLSAVHHRLISAGRTYRADGVRLVAVPAEGASGALTWPAGVPAPAISPTVGFGQSDLHGAPARTVTREIARRDPWDWPAYRTADGRILRVAWRYLLPHELPAYSRNGMHEYRTGRPAASSS